MVRKIICVLYEVGALMFMQNALIAKIKTIYGNRITEEDYDAMLRKKSISELISYLKTLENYQEMFAGFQTDGMRRNRLEELIKSHHYKTMFKLITFIRLKENKFYEIPLISLEKEIILLKIEVLINHEEDDILKNVSTYFETHTKLNLLAISDARSMKELIQSLEGTKYYSLLLPYVALSKDQINYFYFEALLENFYYQYVFSTIDKLFRGKVKQELKNIYQANIEVSNMIKIYRLKKFYQLDNDTIKTLLIEVPRIQHKMNELLNLPEPEDIFIYLKNSKYNRFRDEDDRVYLEYLEDYVKYDIARRNILFSTKASKTFLSFLIYNEIEMKNIIHLIEGIRYNLDEKKIRRLLIY